MVYNLNTYHAVLQHAMYNRLRESNKTAYDMNILQRPILSLHPHAEVMFCRVHVEVSATQSEVLDQHSCARQWPVQVLGVEQHTCR